MIAVCVHVTFPLLYAVQDVVATHFSMNMEELSRAPAIPYSVAVRLI